MSKTYLAENVGMELIKHRKGGDSIQTKTMTIIADPLFFDLLDGMFEDEMEGVGDDGVVGADEINIRYKDKVFSLKH